MDRLNHFYCAYSVRFEPGEYDKIQTELYEYLAKKGMLYNKRDVIDSKKDPAKRDYPKKIAQKRLLDAEKMWKVIVGPVVIDLSPNHGLGDRQVIMAEKKQQDQAEKLKQQKDEDAKRKMRSEKRKESKKRKLEEELVNQQKKKQV